MKELICVCGTRVEKIKTNMELFDGGIILRDVDAYYCPKCKEEILTTNQLSSAREKLKEILPNFEAFSLRKKITQLGNSLSIPISKELAEFMHLRKGEEVRIVVKNRNRLIVDVCGDESPRFMLTSRKFLNLNPMQNREPIHKSLFLLWLHQLQEDFHIDDILYRHYLL